MDIASELKYFALSQGLVAIGSAPVAAYSGAPQGHRPEEFLPDAKTVITFTYRMNQAAIMNLPQTRGQYMMEFNTVNQLLSQAGHKMTRLLEEKGYPSLAISPEAAIGDYPRLKADFSHKHSAVLCGLGQFGLNNLLLTPKYGPGVRLGSVFTTAEITLDTSPIDGNLCDNCGKCVDICPAGALNNYQESYSIQTGRPIDKEKCSHYKFAVHNGNRCGMCIKACLERFL
ncbi:MAG: epoxyqueuosine reductase [Firmicutes bacterium]|nr:epoxyqueuosine reductase [Bacillota bacterium]